jgi:hypothetical protein
VGGVLGLAVGEAPFVPLVSKNTRTPTTAMITTAAMATKILAFDFAGAGTEEADAAAWNEPYS